MPAITMSANDSREKHPQVFSIPPAFESIGDVLDFLLKKGATHADIQLEESNKVPLLVISANVIIGKPKRVLRKKRGLLDVWQVIGDGIVLITELEPDEQATTAKFNLSMSSPAFEFMSVELGKRFRPLTSSFDLAYIELVVTDAKKMYKMYKNACCKGTMIIIPLKKLYPGRTFKYSLKGTQAAGVQSTQVKQEPGEPQLESGTAIKDVLSKSDTPLAAHLNASLRDYLQVYRLVPRLQISVQGTPVTNYLWLRSLRCTETAKLAVEGYDGDVQVTRGVSRQWPLHTSSVLYDNYGRLTNLTAIRGSKNALPKCRKVAIIYSCELTSSRAKRAPIPVPIGELELQTKELAGISHSLIKDPDEFWRICTECNQWREVSSAKLKLESDNFTCAQIAEGKDLGCRLPEADLVPAVGKAQVVTPARGSRTTPLRATRKSIDTVSLKSLEAVPSKKARMDSVDTSEAVLDKNKKVSPSAESCLESVKSIEDSPKSSPKSAEPVSSQLKPVTGQLDEIGEERCNSPCIFLSQKRLPREQTSCDEVIDDSDKEDSLFGSVVSASYASDDDVMVMTQKDPNRHFDVSDDEQSNDGKDEIHKMKQEYEMLISREQRLCTLVVKFFNSVSGKAKLSENLSSTQVITELVSALSQVDVSTPQVP